MPKPELSHTAERLYQAVSPLATEDEANGWPLAHYCAALALPLDQVANLSRDEETRPGWATLFDPDTCPASMLPWLAQFTGVTIAARLDEASARARVRTTDGFRRGTPASIRAAARAHLTGTKTVYLTERHGSRWKLTVTTRTSETPDPARVVAALMDQKPAGILLTHAMVDGGDYRTLRDTHSDYSDVLGDFDTYAAVRDNPA